jgi:hypothetical protein
MYGVRPRRCLIGLQRKKSSHENRRSGGIVAKPDESDKTRVMVPEDRAKCGVCLDRIAAGRPSVKDLMTRCPGDPAFYDAPVRLFPTAAGTARGERPDAAAQVCGKAIANQGPFPRAIGEIPDPSGREAQSRVPPRIRGAREPLQFRFQPGAA